MMCGPGGAGKTTYAKGLEADGWTRLSFEVEFWNRGVTTLPSAEVVAEVSAELKARLLRLIAAGEDVVLDFGFWFRRQRDEYRALLAPQGIVPVTVYIATSLSTVLSRTTGGTVVRRTTGLSQNRRRRSTSSGSSRRLRRRARST